MNENTITVVGNVVNDPELRFTKAGVPFVTFRLASTPRWYNSEKRAWEAGRTNFYSVTAFRGIAGNLHKSLLRGQPIVIQGRLRINQFERPDKSFGTRVEIDAQTVGHDLSLGSAVFTKGMVAIGEDRDRLSEQEVQSALEHADGFDYDVVDPVTGEVATIGRSEVGDTTTHPDDGPDDPGRDPDGDGAGDDEDRSAPERALASA